MRHGIDEFMKITLKKPPHRSTVFQCLGRVALTCFVLPQASAACMDNPDPQPATTRISSLTVAPKAIQDLARSIQGKNRAQVRSIFIQRYGPSQHQGSGADIESWDVAEGQLVLHPLLGPAFNPKGRKSIWLLRTANRALPNILGSFEMTALADRKEMHNWLGDVSLHRNRTYTFQVNDAVADGQWSIQTDNFFKLHPSGVFDIEFAAGCTGETLLESLPDNTVLCRLTFTPKGGGKTETYSIAIDDRRLAFRSDRIPIFEMGKFWNNFWK